MWTILTKPAEAITKAKREKDLGKSMLVLLVAVLIFGLDVLLFSGAVYRSGFGSAFLAGILAAIMFFIGIIILGFLLQVGLHVLTGHDDFFSSVTPLAYSWLVLACGMLIATILGLIPTFIGPLLGVLVMLPTLVLFHVVFIKGIIELYETDLLTAIVAVFIVYTAISMALTWGTAFYGLRSISELLKAVLSGSLQPPMGVTPF